MDRRVKTSLAVIAITLALLAGLAIYGFVLLYTPTAVGEEAESVEFVIEKGERLQSISDRLHEQGLLNDKIALKLATFIQGGGETIKAGRHTIPYGINATEVLQLLRKSPLKEFRVLTIPEGWDMFEIAQAVEDNGIATATEFLELVRSREMVELLQVQEPVESLEGHLFPDTYHVPVDYTADNLIRMMLGRSRQILDQNVILGFQGHGLSLHEGLTLASLIAKEAGNEEEMPLIASVFHNRLERGMKMECDPTFIYAAKLENTWDGIAHQSDIRRDHPYNTYQNSGLPPGPIGNPGRAAIEAALHPAETDYIFFVAKSTDQSEGHDFSSTLREHNRNVRKYRQAKAEER